MSQQNNGRFPYHLAQLVAQRLPDYGLSPPADQVLLRLFEALYFASLKTDEARPCRCTINFVDPETYHEEVSNEGTTSGWMIIPFQERFPLNVRSLLKLADAVDPTVSSLAVCCDSEGELFIWGMVDQEIRYGDYVALNATEDPKRAGIFQATITGVGAVSAFKDFALLGSLEQENLVANYHDVLWEGPVHDRLRDNLAFNLKDEMASSDDEFPATQLTQVKDLLLIRWQNAICRTLFNIQQYGHGGGLIIAPTSPSDDVIVKYNIVYDRLPKALFRLAHHHLTKRQTTESIAKLCQCASDTVPCDVHFDSLQSQKDLDRQKRELLGCVRFVASLSRVDGFVFLDRRLVVHGFGVETRSNSKLVEVDVAGDAAGSPKLFRKVPLSQFGTRHRAMLRYCDANEGALGFVISQDGDIRATMKHRGRLILWENINVQLAYRAENKGSIIDHFSPAMITGLFCNWMTSVTYA